MQSFSLALRWLPRGPDASRYVGSQMCLPERAAILDYAGRRSAAAALAPGGLP
jgi:hypothetical protein